MDTQTVLTLLQDVAARVITPRFRALETHEIHEKGPGDLVTDADREAEVEIASVLQNAHRNAVVLGEEAHALDPSLMERFFKADHAFTIDPIDGTKNFVEGSPDHAVMCAELRDGVVTRSWIWQPQHQVAFVAERGSGAWRNGARVEAAGGTSAEHARWRVLTSYPEWYGARLDGFPPLGPTWICCGIDYPQLASGSAEAILYRGRQMPWDHAPGSLLMSEVGGYVGLSDGSRYEASSAASVENAVTLIATADRTVFEKVTDVFTDGAALR